MNTIVLHGKEVEIKRFYRKGSFKHERHCGGEPDTIVFRDSKRSIWSILPGSEHYDELVALEEAMTVNQEGA